MEMREKNHIRLVIRYLRLNGHKITTCKCSNNEENNCKPDHKRSELLCHWPVKDKYLHSQNPF
jgi:hypothetical protein